MSDPDKSTPTKRTLPAEEQWLTFKSELAAHKLERLARVLVGDTERWNDRINRMARRREESR